MPLEVPILTVEAPDSLRGDVTKLGNPYLVPHPGVVKTGPAFEELDRVALDLKPEPDFVADPRRDAIFTIGT